MAQKIRTMGASCAEDMVSLTSKHSNTKGTVLFSYLNEPILWGDDDKRFDGHTNKWESKEIAKIFTDMGFNVDAISWKNNSFVPQKKYDIVFDIYTNMVRLASFLPKEYIKILHLTGSYPPYQNDAELARIRQLENRRKGGYAPKRIIKDTKSTEAALEMADVCSLIGNKHTLDTYPEKYRNKIYPISVTASKLSHIKSEKDYVPPMKEFLWFSGGGAVHKGLDLLLEVFAKNKNLVLNIAGRIDNEKDFFDIYRRELKETKNIKYFGYVNPNSRKFKKITKNVFCFIMPTCSEGMSPAVATCLQYGLYPIISRDAGVDLPEGCGKYLETCSIEEIEETIKNVYQMSDESLAKEIKTCQEFALCEFSREKFSRDITEFLRKFLGKMN